MRAFLFLLTSAAAWAQLSGPALGLVPDGSQIRQMYGLPGAGAVGNVLNTGTNFAMVVVSSNPNFALATTAENGQVLVVSSGAAVLLTGVLPNPDRIAMSPTGSSAAFWFASTSRFQIVSGLPGPPVTRSVDATFPGGSPTAFAVSDDGNWLAGAFPGGVYAFGPDGSATQLPADNAVAALAFFAQRSDLVLASPQHISSITNVGGSASPSILYTSQGMVPIGIATSSDNLHVVTAEANGGIVAIDLTTSSANETTCGCTPDGVFALTGAVFRLTNAPRGVKLFDASANTILVVPKNPTAFIVQRKKEVQVVLPRATTTLPTLTIGGLPATDGFEQQPAMTISMATTYPTDVTGTVTLTFVSSVGGDDQLIQFCTGATSCTAGRTVNFTIPAGSTTASFSGKSSMTLLTGTVAGTIMVTITSLSSAGASFPAPAATATITTSPTVPFVQTVTLSTTANTATVVVTGFASSRDMVSGLFTFAPSMNSSIAQAAITVPLASAFSTWYSNPASNAYGSEFTLTVPFNVQGSGLDIVAVSVTLTDSKGSSTPVSQ